MKRFPAAIARASEAYRTGLDQSYRTELDDEPAYRVTWGMFTPTSAQDVARTRARQLQEASWHRSHERTWRGVESFYYGTGGGSNLELYR